MKNKKLWILLGVVVVILIIGAIVLQGKKPAAQPLANNTPVTSAPTTPTSATSTPNVPTAVNPILKDAQVVVPGANPITKDNKVVTAEGKPTLNNVSPMTPSAPQETPAISKESLAKNAKVTQITASAAGFVPNSFTVAAGAPVTFSVTSIDTQTHVFAFYDPSLSAVAVGIGPGETRAITFNAPTKAGEYIFYCNVPGHPSRGETGKMIVK